MPPRAARTKGDTKKAGPRLAAARAAADVPADGSDRRKQILKAAVKVFAERGYHGCRISDVAEEAGVAYGLVYHYYGNKDGLLGSIFDTNWAFFGKAVDEIANGPGDTPDKIAQIVDFVFQAYELSPLVVKVLILEFGRSSRLGEALDHPTVGRVFEAITRLFKDAAKRGELRPEIEPWAMTMIFVGAMETAIASFVLGGKRAREKPSLDAMKKSLVTTLLHGALREG